MSRIILILIGMFFSLTAYADMNDTDKSRAWDCSGIYMANYFLPSGETFEYSMNCLLYTSPSPRDLSTSRMPSSA